MTVKSLKFNPAFLSDEDIIDNFVVRNAEFKQIIRSISEDTLQTNRHVLVIGPRGMGKTMLVLRIAAELRRDQELREKWHPVTFSEESYNVTTLGEFWLQALLHLCEQTENIQLQEKYKELLKRQDDELVQTGALKGILEFADKKKKRLILIVENLNMIFNEQMKADDARSILNTFLCEPRLMLLATATGQFDRIKIQDKAFENKFHEIKLLPLNEKDCEDIWESVAGSKPEDRRIRPIQILTGGNPRLLSIVSTYGKNKSLNELLENLIELVDDHTEYFKSHLESLAATERKVYLSLTGIWSPATAKEIAGLARMSVSKASSLLKRLENRGMVVSKSENKRRKTYQISERMFNIYHVMRHQGTSSSMIQALVNFIIGLYGEKSLAQIMQDVISEAGTINEKDRHFHYQTFFEIYKLHHLDPDKFEIPDEILGVLCSSLRKFDEVEKSDDNIRKVLDNEELKAALVKVKAELKTNLSEERVQKFQKWFDSEKSENLIVSMFHHWQLIGHAYWVLEQWDEVEYAFKKSLELHPDDFRLIMNLGSLNFHLKRFDEAEKLYFQSVKMKPCSENWSCLGSLYRERKMYDLAEEYYLKSLETKSFMIFTATNLVCMTFIDCRDREKGSVYLDKYLITSYDVGHNLDWVINTLIELCADDFSRDVLAVIERSEHRGKLESFLTGIRLYLGENEEDFKVPPEVIEIGKDVKERIEKKKTEKEDSGD